MNEWAKGHFVRFVRRWQDLYHERQLKHLDGYDVDDGARVSDLYHGIMYYVYQKLYWWCVLNVKYKKDDKP